MLVSIRITKAAISARSRGLAWTISELLRKSAVTRPRTARPACSSSACVLEEFVDRRLGIDRRRMFEPEDPELGRRWHRLVELRHEVDNRLDVLLPTDEQQGIRLDQRSDADRALPREIDLFVEAIKQCAEGLTGDMLEWVNNNLRLGLLAQLLDLLNQLPHPGNVPFVTADDNHVRAFKELDIDRPDGPATEQFGRRRPEAFAGEGRPRGLAFGRFLLLARLFCLI